MFTKLKDLKIDVAMMGCIGLVVSICFWKVIFLAQPISRVFLLAKRDVLFARYFTPGRSGFDESVFLLLAPYYRLVAHYCFPAPHRLSFPGSSGFSSDCRHSLL